MIKFTNRSYSKQSFFNATKSYENVLFENLCLSGVKNMLRLDFVTRGVLNKALYGEPPPRGPTPI